MKPITKNEIITKKIILILKILLAISTVICSLFLNVLSGIGWISTYGQYGNIFSVLGALMLFSSALMTVSFILCNFKLNISAILTQIVGFLIAIISTIKMMNYADERGWNDPATMQPASDIFRNHTLPTIIPLVLLISIAILQYFSYDGKIKRKLKRDEKEKKENMPAPKILED